MRHLHVSFLFAAAVLVATACQTTQETTASAEAEPIPPVKEPTFAPYLTREDYLPVVPPVTEETFLQLVEGGVPDALRNTIEIRNYQTDITRIEGLPEVSLEVFNRLDEQPITFEIRTLWFRADGSIIDASEWVKATVPPRAGYPYRALCFTEFAEKEQVQIRLLTSAQSQG